MGAFDLAKCRAIVVGDTVIDDYLYRKTSGELADFLAARYGLSAKPEVISDADLVASNGGNAIILGGPSVNRQSRQLVESGCLQLSDEMVDEAFNIATTGNLPAFGGSGVISLAFARRPPWIRIYRSPAAPNYQTA